MKYVSAHQLSITEKSVKIQEKRYSEALSKSSVVLSPLYNTREWSAQQVNMYF